MYFTSGSDRAFEQLMQGKPGFDHYDSGEAVTPEDCGKCFTAAAALTAVSLLRAAQDGEVSEFGAAGLSVKLHADGGAMRKLAEELLAPWCDGGTAFRGVRA